MAAKRKTKAPPVPQGRYLRRFTLENVRTFRSRVALDFCHDDGSVAQWTVILGENGTGKTTLLQYLAGMMPIDILAPAPPHRRKPSYGPMLAGLKWENWHAANLPNDRISAVGINAQLDVSDLNGELRLAKASSSGGIHLMWRFERKNDQVVFGGCGTWQQHESDLSKEVRVFGYGATRHVASAASPYISSETFFQNGGNDPTSTLFHDDYPLISPEQWFLGLDHASNLDGEAGKAARRAFESAKRCLKSALPGLDNVAVKPKHSGKGQPMMTLLCNTPFGEVPLSALSVGYRTMAAWLTDFIKRMHEAFPEMDEPDDGPAVVLIDEFDLHMHPTWQRKAMAALSREFPNTQFIVTAHSPLVVQAANQQRAKIVVLQRRRRGDGLEEVVIADHPREAAGWRVDQILESFYGVSADSPRYEELSRERVRLRQKEKLRAAEKRRLAARRGGG